MSRDCKYILYIILYIQKMFQLIFIVLYQQIQQIDHFQFQPNIKLIRYITQVLIIKT